MLSDKTIAVVVPAHNEVTQIGNVIESMPDFVDRIVVVNDCSTDDTAEIVRGFWKTPLNKGISIKNITEQPVEGRFEHANQVMQIELKKDLSYLIPSEVENSDAETERIILISNSENGGVGSAIARGYKWCRDYGIDCVAVMDGDGQMDPGDLEKLCRPIVDEKIDYVKGNRLVHRTARMIMPKVRYWGNSVLSFLTKFASGYWHISDTQSGYNAISKKALNAIEIHRIYRSYGAPNDILVKLNIAMCTVKEVEIKPVYDIGEKSKMRILKVVLPISWLLFKSFFERIWMRFFIRDFHPLFLLYHMSFILFFASLPFLKKILGHALITQTNANPVTVMAFVFLAVTAFQSLLFAMWMDIQDNERFYVSR